MEKIPVTVVVGPTAAGKTALGVALAKQLNGEIISADSMQIYRGMDIATAKPSKEEQQGIPHHLMDFLPPAASYSVAAFVKDARRAAADIRARGKAVIVVGGTGLYTDSLIRNTVFEDEPDHTQLRRKLQQRLQTEGAQTLYDELRAVDPAYAESLCPKNEVRLIRALEIWYLTGETPTERRRRAVSCASDFDPVWIGVGFRDRQALYDRIERRVDAMLEAGLLQEAERYYAEGYGATAAQAIGYKELQPYLRGDVSLQAAKENLIRATRRYAKRQMTWFRRNPDIHWIFRDDMTEDEILQRAMEWIGQQGADGEGIRNERSQKY